MSKLREAFEKGEFAITAEMAPPKGTDLSHLAECAKLVIGRVHAANVTDNQSAVMRTSSLATCKMLKDNKCSIHLTRPPICRRYPQEELVMMGGALSEGCGYRLEPILTFEEVLENVMKKS